MIIVSQDKEKIINFDNVTHMYISETYRERRNYSIKCMLTSSDYTLIGEYQTEERAKAIVEKIEKCYANTEQYKCLSSMPNCNSEEKIKVLNELAENAFVYEMPKE